MSISLNKESLKVWQDEKLEYLRYQYDLKPTDKCLDLGSYQMEWANEIIKRYGCKVECFDALDNKAAWVYDGKIAMGDAFYYTSLYADKIDKEYWCVDIAKYLQEEIAVMKINIEGGEYVLLNYIIQKGLHKNVKNIQVQFHLIDGMDCGKLHLDIYKELKKTHKLTWDYPFCWENYLRC